MNRGWIDDFQCVEGCCIWRFAVKMHNQVANHILHRLGTNGGGLVGTIGGTIGAVILHELIPGSIHLGLLWFGVVVPCFVGEQSR